MKIVFFGSSHFAVPALEALIKSQYEICSVVTQPDKKKGRHLHLGSTDVKALAKQAGLKIFQPESVNYPDSIEHLKSLSADLFVVVAYGQILSQAVLDIPKIFPINIHASLLPKYRGAAPINWAIINGEKSSGVTIIKLIRKMDAGPIITQREIPVNDSDDSVALEDELRKLGAELLIEALQKIKNGDYKLIDQDEKKAVMAPKLKKNDGSIDWDKPAISIHDLVRGCLPWPGAFTYYKGKILKLYKTEVIPLISGLAGLRPGEILRCHKDGFEVMTGSGALLIKELQLEGGQRMPSAEFVHGHKIKPGDRLGKK